MTDKRVANAKIADLLAQAQTLITEAETIADEAGVTFSIDFGGYGSGATYTGAAVVEEWEASEYDVVEGNGFWLASSQSC